MMTIIIHFHQSHYRDFKTYYIEYVCQYLRGEFPNLVSYNRFIELMPRVLLPLCCYLPGRKGEVSGISFVDPTRITVCGNKRISRNQVFKEVAELGKSSRGWFFGFKLHLVVNDQGELLAFCLTPGNVIRKNMKNRPAPLLDKLLARKRSIIETINDQLKNISQIEHGRHRSVTNIMVNLVAGLAAYTHQAD